MKQTPIIHGFYTNAPGWDDGRGFRCIFPDAALDATLQDHLAGWLKTWRPDQLRAVDERGYIVRVMHISERYYSSLTVIDKRYNLDYSGRSGGYLVQTLLAPIEWDACVHTALLLRVARETENCAPSVEQLVRRCSETRWAPCEPNEPAPDANDIDPLKTLLEALCGAESVVDFPEADHARLPELLTRLCAYLPPRLRHSVAWSVGIQPGQGYLAAPFPGKSSSLLRPHRLLHDSVVAALQKGQPAELLRMRADATVGNWDQLAHRLTNDAQSGPLTIAAPAPALTLTPEFAPQPSPAAYANDDSRAAAETNVARNDFTTSPSAETFDEQYRAIELTLRQYIDQRLERSAPQWSEAAPARTLLDHDASAGEDTSLWPQLVEYRAELYFLVCLVLIAILFVRIGRSPEPTDNAAAAAPAEAAGSLSFASYVEDNRPRIVTYLAAMQQQRGLERGVLAQDDSIWLGEMQQRVADGAQLRRTSMDSLRDALFDYVYGIGRRPGEAESGSLYRLDFRDNDHDPELLARLFESEQLPVPERDRASNEEKSDLLWKWLGSKQPPGATR